MKLLVDIDEEIVSHLREVTGSKTDAEALLVAAEDMSKRSYMKKHFSLGPPPTDEEIRNTFFPGYKLDREIFDLGLAALREK